MAGLSPTMPGKGASSGSLACAAAMLREPRNAKEGPCHADRWEAWERGVWRDYTKKGIPRRGVRRGIVAGMRDLCHIAEHEPTALEAKAWRQGRSDLPPGRVPARCWGDNLTFCEASASSL